MSLQTACTSTNRVRSGFGQGQQIHDISFLFLSSNHYPLAKLLVDHGSDLGSKNDRGCTPVHLVAALGFSKILALFLEQKNCPINAQVTNFLECIYKSLLGKDFLKWNLIKMQLNLSYKACVSLTEF